MTLFGLEEHPLLEEIRGAKLDAISPDDALELISTWQQRLVEENTAAKS